ncbi:MAG: NAD+ synthase [Vulcanimicrobiaceae bacterium]
MLPVVEAQARYTDPPGIDAALAQRWLVAFLREELVTRRGMSRAVLGLSGGIDSALTAYLCTQALGPESVYAFRLPYTTSSAQSLEDAALVVNALGIHCRTIDIAPAVDGYLKLEPDANARRRGNVMARVRMLVLFDQSAKLGALPIGTGNKTERLLGYYTWHADDAPPINPLGDLFKTQVWRLAEFMGVPAQLIDKAPSADLEPNQTDEADLGISYLRADALLAQLLQGAVDAQLIERGFDPAQVRVVRARLDRTHWKRHLPTTAMLSNTAINEFYLRPVDY